MGLFWPLRMFSHLWAGLSRSCDQWWVLVCFVMWKQAQTFLCLLAMVHLQLFSRWPIFPLQCGSRRDNHMCQQDTFFFHPCTRKLHPSCLRGLSTKLMVRIWNRKLLLYRAPLCSLCPPLRAAALPENASLTGKNTKPHLGCFRRTDNKAVRPQKLLKQRSASWQANWKSAHIWIFIRRSQSLFAFLTKTRTKEMFAHSNDKGRYKTWVIQN